MSKIPASYAKIIALDWFVNLSALTKTQFTQGRSERATSLGISDQKMISRLGTPIPNYRYSIEKNSSSKEKFPHQFHLKKTKITSETKLALTRERCRHLLHSCSHPSSSCRDAAAQHLWSFRSSLSLQNFSTEFLTFALSPPQPSLHHTRCRVLLFGISPDQAEAIHQWRDEFLGHRLIDWLIPQTQPQHPLLTPLHKILQESASEAPFPVRRQIANHPSLNWRVFSHLLTRGLPLHSREAIEKTNYQTFLRSASASEKSGAQTFLSRLAKLSPDLKKRVHQLTQSQSLSAS